MISQAVTVHRTRRSLRVPVLARLSVRVALAPLVMALVVGILGMHALASHGTPTPPATTPSGTGMVGMTAAHEATMTSGDSHDGLVGPSAGEQVATAQAVADLGSGPGHEMGGMVMLCVLMLAAAAFTLLVLLAARFLRPLLPAAFHPAAVRLRAPQRMRGTGPPHEWQFSVIRC